MIITNEAISVVLTCRNDLKTLRKSMRLWPSVCRGYLKGSELIVCDYGSTDGTEEFFEDFLEKWDSHGLKIVYLRKDDVSVLNSSELRNMARKYVSSNYVLFSNGNCYPASNLLGEYSPHLDLNTVLFGKVKRVASPFNHAVVLEDTYIDPERMVSVDKDKKPWEVFRGNNSVIPRTVLEQVGWFDEDFIAESESDALFCMSSRFELSTKFQFVEEALVFRAGKRIKYVDHSENVPLMEKYAEYRDSDVYKR